MRTNRFIWIDDKMFFFLLDSKKDNSPLKIFLTPVVGAHIDAVEKIAGPDMIPYGEFQRSPSSPAEIGQFVFDLIAPCPGTCDIASPLYQAGNSNSAKRN